MAATRQTLTWVRNERGTPANVVTLPEGTSQTYKKGALLMWDVSDVGVVEAARTAGIPDDDSAFGIAYEDASGTDGDNQDVLIPQAGDVFAVSLASDADTMVAPVAGTHLGLGVGIVKLSTTGGAGTEYVANTGDDDFAQIVGLYPPDVEKRGGLTATFSAGDRVLIQFASDAFRNRVAPSAAADGQIA